MKGKVLITLMVGLLLLSFVSSPAFSGVEPMPWHTQVNMLNSVMNNFDSINRRLEDVLRPPNPNLMKMPAPEGRMGRLEAVANQLKLVNEKIMQTMSGVPMEPVPPEIEMVVMDINAAAMETARMARMGLRDEKNEGVRHAFSEVLMAADMIIHTLGDWMMNPIDVTLPSNEAVCLIGYPCYIEWDTSNIQGWNFVWLEVVYPDGSECCGAYPVPNTGEYHDWKPDPSWADPGVLCQPFRIKVYTNGDEWGVSGLFKVGTGDNICTWQ